MKKIIAITAMAAMVAAAAVAADVSAGIKIDVNAFEYDAATKEAKALTVNHHNNDWESPISFSVSGENAGATLHLCEGSGTDINSTKWNIWVKPIDMLTINVGHWDTNLNQESITWGGTKSGIGSQGLTFSLAPVEGFTFDATFAPGYGTPWFSKGDGTDAVIKELGFKVQYSADFGTVNAIFDYKGKTTTAATEATAEVNPAFDPTQAVSATNSPLIITAGTPASETPAEMKFGAGYKNTFDPLTIWVNVLGFVKGSDFDAVRVEAFQEAGLDALTVKAFEAFQFNTNLPDGADTKAKIDLGAKFYLGYKLGESTTAYLKIQDDDFLADAFSMSINPGLEFKVGDCGIDAGIEFTAQENIKVAVPVKFSMNF